MISSPRPLNLSEQGAALRLWQSVFETPPGYFERYFETDSQYQLGDTLGIWDDSLLVSAVHLCRRPAAWGESPLLCGSIANVATLPDYRKQGLSRHILREMVAKMEREGFAYSLLGTGTHGHYAALDWERAHRPQVTLAFALAQATSEASWQKVGSASDLQPLYDFAPRPLQFRRDTQYFNDWVQWVWQQSKAVYCAFDDRGYLVLSIPARVDEAVSVLEWRARDEETERQLFQTAIALAEQKGHSELWLEAWPQYLSRESLETLGEVKRYAEGDTMIRNVSLSNEEYAKVAEAYRSGAAAWWPGDGF